MQVQVNRLAAFCLILYIVVQTKSCQTTINFDLHIILVICRDIQPNILMKQTPWPHSDISHCCYQSSHRCRLARSILLSLAMAFFAPRLFLLYPGYCLCNISLGPFADQSNGNNFLILSD